VVEVGLDDDGDPITSCVVTETDETPPVTAGRQKLGKNEETMLGILNEHMPEGLTQDRWNELARDEGVGMKRRADLNDCRRRLKAKKRIYESCGTWFVQVH